MSITKEAYSAQVRETVKMAREMAKEAFERAMESGDDDRPQSQAEIAKILADHQWLCANFKQVPVNPPGTRMRMGWAAEALDALTKHNRAAQREAA